jgi:hypothetical protein
MIMLIHHMSKMCRGDNIVAIDGMRVNELNIISVIKETNVIGAPCCLTIARAGHECEIPLVRWVMAFLCESVIVLCGWLS